MSNEWIKRKAGKIPVDGNTLVEVRSVLGYISSDLAKCYQWEDHDHGYVIEYRIASDKINPEHYKTGGIETIDYLKAKLSPEELKGFLKGNIIKYLSRAELKNGAEDYKKASWYMDQLVKLTEK